MSTITPSNLKPASAGLGPQDASTAAAPQSANAVIAAKQGAVSARFDDPIATKDFDAVTGQRTSSGAPAAIPANSALLWGLKVPAAQNEAALSPGNWGAYLHQLDQNARTSNTGKNKVEFLVDGSQVVPRVLHDLDQAKSSIHLQVFQWQPDETGWALAKKLGEKAGQGVKVRVLLDAWGAHGDGMDKTQPVRDYLKQHGVEVAMSYPPGPLGLVNYDDAPIDHRKLLVVDGKIAYTGGMNVGNDYQKKWHDQQSRIEGPAVGKLQSDFIEYWGRYGGTPPAASEARFPPISEVEGGSDLRVLSHERNQDSHIKDAYLTAFKTAEHSIRIANPYFADADVVKALCEAARRGVKVQVVLPRECDIPQVKSAAHAFYPDLLKAGVELYEYTGKMAHEKVAVIDSKWSTFGSSNLDARSLRTNDELNVLSTDPSLARDIERKLFDVDLQHAERVLTVSPTLEERFNRLISPIL